MIVLHVVAASKKRKIVAVFANASVSLSTSQQSSIILNYQNWAKAQLKYCTGTKLKYFTIKCRTLSKTATTVMTILNSPTKTGICTRSPA